MLKNYFNIALRSLQRNAIYSFINISGLSIGIASTILIILWVHDELSYNKYFRNYNTIHQIKVNTKTDNGVITSALTAYPLKDALPQDSRIKRFSLCIGQSALLSVGETKIRKSGLDASGEFLEMFDLKMIHGDRQTALTDPMSIVLTQSSARALFGRDDVVGKMVSVKIENTEDLKVTGVIEDLPSNVSLSLNFVLPFSYFERTAPWLKFAEGNWTNNSFQAYAQLHDEADKEAVGNSIRDLVKKNSAQGGQDVELFLHPMSHWRLHNNFVNGKESGGLIDYVVMFSCIAVFILAMACINFMNLTTARSQHRAREVGIRKSVGSTRKELIFQFVGESIMISTIALFISIVLVELSLPFYNALVNKSLYINYASITSWSFAITLIVFTGLVAGSYPAFYLSSFKPAKILKGNTQATKKGTAPRQILVTLQNAFSILLIIGTAVVYQQILLLKHREAGYDRENLMLLWSNVDIEKNYHALKEELLSTHAAEAITKSNSPVTRIFANSTITWPGMMAGQHVEATNIATEYDYTKTLGIKMLAGRDFSPEYKSDTSSIIVNKAAVAVMNLKDPIGEKIDMWGQSWTIIGVMDDVLMGGSAEQIGPMVMTFDPTWSSTITVRIPKTQDVTSAVSAVERIFKKYTPDYPFEYRFADTEFQQKFSTIEMTSRLSGAFAVLAIIITALGLFGMASFTAEQRTKEIGIRKVLGASISSVLFLLIRDFSKLVVIAFIISVPFAWWATTNFLEKYQVRIEMPYWIFPVAGIASLLITVIIVSSQGLRAAIKNPVDSLKSE